MGRGNAVTDELRLTVERFRRETGVARVLVFGSQARGEAGPHSDVDLILVDKRFRGQPFFERPVGLRRHWPAEIPVDLLCYTPEEFEELKSRPTLVRHAIDEGAEIAG